MTIHHRSSVCVRGWWCVGRGGRRWGRCMLFRCDSGPDGKHMWPEWFVSRPSKKVCGGAFSAWNALGTGVCSSLCSIRGLICTCLVRACLKGRRLLLWTHGTRESCSDVFRVPHRRLLRGGACCRCRPGRQHWKREQCRPVRVHLRGGQERTRLRRPQLQCKTGIICGGRCGTWRG